MDSGTSKPEWGAGRLMLLSAFLYALVPVWVGFGNAGASPFFFSAIAHLAAIPCILAYTRFYRSEGDVLNSKFIKAALEYQPRGWMLACLVVLAICTTSYAFFSMASKSLEYSNLPIVAAIYEAWPVLAIVAFVAWRQPGKMKEGIKSLSLGSFLIALVGLGFIVSAREEVSLVHLLANLAFGEWKGIFFSFVSSVLAAGIVVFTQRPGEYLAESIFGSNRTEQNTINCTMLIVVFMHISGFAISAILGLEAGESIPVAGSSLFAIVMGVTIGCGAISFRVASIKSKNPGIIALSFLTPLLALGVLLVLSLLDISPGDGGSGIRWDYLAMGGTAIFSANLLLNLRADLRTGYRSLVLCLWTFGAIRYLFDGVPWEWYYESIAVATGILAITVGFRSERFVRRSQLEETLSIDILHALTWLIDKHQSHQGLIKARREFFSAHSPEKSKTMGKEERESHRQMMKILGNIRREEKFEQDHEIISRCLRKADELILSRAHGNNFGEKIAIFGMMLASAGISLFLRNEIPEGAAALGIDALAGNFFSLLVGPVAVFLYFHVVDLERDRSREIYDEDLRIVREIHDRAGEKLAAAMILLVTFGTYAALFWFKHL